MFHSVLVALWYLKHDRFIWLLLNRAALQTGTSLANLHEIIYACHLYALKDHKLLPKCLQPLPVRSPAMQTMQTPIQIYSFHILTNLNEAAKKN